MKRKLLSLLLALALLLTMLPQAATPARAEDKTGKDPYSGTCGEDLTWTFDPDTGTLTIEGSGDMEDYSYDSPAPWNDCMADICSLSLSKGLRSIGDLAFEGAWNLQSVSFPGSVRRIGFGAFHGGKEGKTPLEPAVQDSFFVKMR